MTDRAAGRWAPQPDRLPRRIVAGCLVAMTAALAVLTAFAVAPVAAAADLPPPRPVPPLPTLGAAPTGQATVAASASAPLLEVPAGCPAPAEEQAVFIGTMVLGDAATARFRVDQLRAGELDGYTRDGLVDVHYGDDVRFLDTSTRYLIGVAPDPVTRVLVSKVRPAAPLFGGSQIEGVPGDDCPQVPDPLRTVLLDGAPIDTGVLSPLADAPGAVLRAILLPVGGAVVALMVLALARPGLAAMFAALRRSR